MNVLVLKKRTWARGRRRELPALLEESGKLCCLGFLALACGAQREQLDGAPMPEDAPDVKWPKGIVKQQGGDTPLCRKIAKVNDDPRISDAMRSARLRPLFKRIGYRLTVRL